MTNMERSLILPVIREMRVKATVGYHLNTRKTGEGIGEMHKYIFDRKNG